MATILEESGQIEITGERDFSRILTMEDAPDGMSPRVSVVAHRLVTEYGLSVVAHLKAMFPECGVLVHGDHESLQTSAELLAVGAAGYFNTTQPPGYLPKAVLVVSQGKMWGPREAVALMAQRTIERAQRTPKPHTILETGEISGVHHEELLILKYLHEGLANKEIASRLGLAEVTVKAKLGRLYKKFGVNTRLQLLSAAIRQGLVV
jgi:DNA-binding NarL/FixJ family response regulator